MERNLENIIVECIIMYIIFQNLCTCACATDAENLSNPQLYLFLYNIIIMRVVIVGGVAGGATAAARLRRLAESAHITIFERSPWVSFA